jgi:predicted DNA-binding protein YlxM (UPF0122 family)
MKIRNYSRQEIDQFGQWILEGISLSEIAQKMGITKQAVYKFRHRHFKELPPRATHKWNDHKLAIAQEILDSEGRKRASEYLGISKGAIDSLVRVGKLTRRVSKFSIKDQPVWTEKEIDFLIDKAGIWSMSRLATKLGRTYSAIRTRMVSLRKDGLIGSGRGELGDWSVREVSKILNCSETALHTAIKRKDLKAKRYNRWYSIAPSTLLLFLERAKKDKRYRHFWDIPKDTMEWIKDCEKGSYWGSRETH